jgi:thiol-disulfide isomerase/thioredoxin
LNKASNVDASAKTCRKRRDLCLGGIYALLSFVLLAGGALSASAESPLLHKRAPAFVRRDLTGTRVNLRADHGKVVLLNFWATWCGPCLLELPRFSAWQKQYGPAGLQVIAVSMDDDATPVRAMARKLNLDFPVVMGDDKLGTLYGGVLGLPVTYLIGRDGTVSARFEGETDLHAMETRIGDLLQHH